LLGVEALPYCAIHQHASRPSTLLSVHTAHDITPLKAFGALDPAWATLFSPNITFVKALEGCHNPVYFPADGSKSDIHEGCPRGPEKAAGYSAIHSLSP
jgi:hypothetical protein